MSKLSNEQQEVWDRLLKGIPPPPEYSYLEVEVSRFMAEELRKEIDREIIADIMNMANLDK